MENKEKNIEILIEKLQTNKPELTNGKELTDIIMKNIVVSNKKENKRIKIIQIFSSAAAIILIAIFLFQKDYYKEYDSEINNIISPKNELKINESCLEILNETENVISAYLCYLQSNIDKNNKLKNPDFKN